jgi:hypothetical protein
VIWEGFGKKDTGDMVAVIGQSNGWTWDMTQEEAVTADRREGKGAGK